MNLVNPDARGTIVPITLTAAQWQALTIYAAAGAAVFKSYSSEFRIRQTIEEQEEQFKQAFEAVKLGIVLANVRPPGSVVAPTVAWALWENQAGFPPSTRKPQTFTKRLLHRVRMFFQAEHKGDA